MQCLTGPGIAVCTDSVIKDPVMFFVKTVIYIALIQLMRGFLFPSKRTKVQVQIEPAEEEPVAVQDLETE